MPIREKLKFKNDAEAQAWSRFAAAVIEACDSDQPEELVGEAAELADKFIVEEYRVRARRE